MRALVRRVAAAGCRRRRSGTVALEFALVMPVMVAGLLGVTDAGRALIAWQSITRTAAEVAEIATAEAAVPNAQGNYQLTDPQVQDATTAIYAFLPQLNGGTDTSSFAVTLTSVVFSYTCNGNNVCTSTATTAWSVVGSFSPSVAAVVATYARACGTLAQTLPGSNPSLTTLPTEGVSGLSSLVVADVQYTFTPLFFNFITGPITMFRSAYLPTRVGSVASYVQYVAPTGVQTDYDQICSGYQ